MYPEEYPPALITVMRNEASKFSTLLDLENFIEDGFNYSSSSLSADVKVIGIIGKDYPDHGKAENINLYLGKYIFPEYTKAEDTLQIKAYYSEEHQIIFLLYNGMHDNELLRLTFIQNEDNKSFFERIEDSERSEIRALAYLFSTCHFVIFFEETSRVDVNLMSLLRKVNVYRKSIKEAADISLNKENLEENSLSVGRLTVPRILMAFLRNNVRSDLGATKKRDIYGKLELSLEGQIKDCLVCFGLMDKYGESLCTIDSDVPFVHLINPRIISRDVYAEMIETLSKPLEERDVPSAPTNNSFISFLNANLNSIKTITTLEDTLKAFKALYPILNGEMEKSGWRNDEGGKKSTIDKMLSVDLEKKNFYNIISGAVSIYSMHSSKHFGPVSHVRTKVEHDKKFADSVNYLKSVCGVKQEMALEVLRETCDKLWNKGMRPCEQLSLTGIPCSKKVHPFFGDEDSAEYQWSMHDSNETLLSTCACGKRQALRFDPFTVKEANYDFYLLHIDFGCCQLLKTHNFQLYSDDIEDKDWELYADRHSNTLESSTNEISGTDEEDEGNIHDEEDSEKEEQSSESDSEYKNYNSSDSENCEVSSNAHPVSTIERLKKASMEFAKRLNKLKAANKGDEFVEGVPNSLTDPRLPLFPSWVLTCLGDSSIYNHATGLRDQPNFKIGGEFLTPVVFSLNVDISSWNKDLQKLRNDDYLRKYKTSNDGTVRVKLFVGFEYECSRGHRFFVNDKGEPLIYRKRSNVVQESSRYSLENLTNTDLPLRRPCTCKKKPLKSAQLMKIHVVTPKAPVIVTLHPQVEISDHDGVYGTGEEPLKLSHSKYYILQMPFVYSGPSGVFIHKKNDLERKGTLKSGSIKVEYQPSIFSYRW